MMQRAATGQLVRAARDLARRYRRVLVTARTLNIRVNHNVMSGIDTRGLYTQPSQRPHHHLTVFVASKVVAWADDTPVDVSRVVEDCSATAPPPYQVYVSKARRVLAALGC